MNRPGTPRDLVRIDLAVALPALLPRAVAWAEAQARLVMESGVPLDAAGRALARRVGVKCPEKIRVSVVDRIPVPAEPELRAAAVEVGLLGPDTLGLTLGYAVLVRRGHQGTTRLLSHEFRHVHQYERAGSIGSFLPLYLGEIVAYGYAGAPSEIDARAHECER